MSKTDLASLKHEKIYIKLLYPYTYYTMRSFCYLTRLLYMYELESPPKMIKIAIILQNRSDII